MIYIIPFTESRLEDASRLVSRRCQCSHVDFETANSLASKLAFTKGPL